MSRLARATTACCGDDRLEQIMQAVIDRRRDDRDERLVDAAERLVETAQQFGGKTRGKGRARLVDQRADGFEAEPAQRRAGFRRKPQGFDRQGGKRRGFLARRQNAEGRGVKARQRPGRAGRSGDGKPRRQAEMAEPGGKIGDELLLAAEQMRRAFDVEEKTVGAVVSSKFQRRSGRRVARRPQGEPAQRGIVGGGIDGAHLQNARFRPRVGQGFADRKSGLLRRLVQGGDARTAGAGNGKDERPVRIDRLACRD